MSNEALWDDERINSAGKTYLSDYQALRRMRDEYEAELAKLRGAALYAQEKIMSDEWTLEDKQDSLDYTQWKAEQDWERANMGEVEALKQQIAQLEASQEALLASAHERHLQMVRLSEHSDPYYYCAACGWSGPRSQLIWSVPRRFICPECKSDKVHRSNDEVASLKIELAAALADLIEYRMIRYADSAVEEARYRELTGHAYYDEE